MPPQRRARESGGGRRITNVATLLRASFVARVPRVRRHFRRLLCHARPKHVLAVVPRSKHVLALVPRPRPTESHPKHILALVPRSRPTDLCAPAPVTTPFAMPPDALALAAMNAMSADVPAVKQAIELVRTCRAPLRRQTKGGRAAARRAPCVPTHPRGMPPRMRRSGAHMRRAGTRSPGCWALHLDTIEAGEPVERERHHCRLSLLSETSP